MENFQCIAFFIEIPFYLLITIIGILFATNIIKYDKSFLRTRQMFEKTIEVVLRIALFVFMLYIIYALLVPRVLDIPNVINGNYKYISGYITKKETRPKQLYEEVYIGNMKLSFFITSGIKKGVKYKIEYLPHSHRGISAVKENIENLINN